MTGTLSAAFEFTEKTVDDVEIPLTQLVALPPVVTPRQVRAVVEASGYSRYVIASADGAPTSYLHVKDVLDLVAPQDLDAPVPGDRIRQLATVPGDAELEDALAQIREAGSHLATVADAQGTITGVLFLEDIVEELIGEVQDATRA